MAYEKNYAKHYDLFNKEKDYGFEARFLKDIMIRFDKNTDGLKIFQEIYRNRTKNALGAAGTFLYRQNA